MLAPPPRPRSLQRQPGEGHSGRVTGRAEAWRQMMATPDVGVALTHKVLYHK